jgi:hypothetical protein
MTSPKYPEIIHYHGEGVFMLAGRTINLRKKFKQQNPCQATSQGTGEYWRVASHKLQAKAR